MRSMPAESTREFLSEKAEDRAMHSCTVHDTEKTQRAEGSRRKRSATGRELSKDFDDRDTDVRFQCLVDGEMQVQQRQESAVDKCAPNEARRRQIHHFADANTSACRLFARCLSLAPLFTLARDFKSDFHNRVAGSSREPTSLPKMQTSRHMPEEPEVEPLPDVSILESSVPAGDPFLRDFLAFVDTFPTNRDHLLDEHAEAATINTESSVVELVNDDDERSQPPRTSPQSKDQQRREANRRRERNKYLRKKERIPRLRAEVEKLAEVLADYENGRTRPAGPEISLAKANAKEQQLVQIAQQKNELLVENAQLRKQFHRAAAFSTNLQQMLNNEHKLYLANSSYFLVLKPLTIPDCQRELTRSLNVIMPTYSVVKSVNRAREICGWNEKRLTERADFHNLKSKLLRGKSARFVFNQTWEVFLDPFRTAKLFAPIMNVRCRLVQRIDDNNVLFRYEYAASRVLSEKTDIPSVSTMALVTRVSTETGHLIITRGLRRGCVEVQDLMIAAPDLRREIWLESLTWIHFEQRGQDCEVTIGGVTPALRQSSYFWMVECVQLALRWEQAVFGPRFRAT